MFLIHPYIGVFCNDFVSDTGRSPKILQQLTSTNIITHTECVNLMDGLKVTQKMICASDIDSGFCDVSKEV